jgi:uncharacterized protein
LLYLSSPVAAREAWELGAALGSMPPTFLRPAIEAGTVLELEPVHVLTFGELDLFFAPHTASWCLLDSFEGQIASDLRGVSFAALCSRYSGVAWERLREFLVCLYQRGLLRLNDEPGLDPNLVRDGALYRGHDLIEILVTQKCNLACLYCLAEAGPDMPHMHPEVAYAAVDAAFELPGSRPLAIQLSGGEPFVNFRLFKSLVAYIREKEQETGRGVHLCTQTNGTLVTDEVAQFIKAHGIAVGVSVDGPSSLNNESRPMLGGRPSHEKTIRGIKTLQRHGITFGTILVLNRVNVCHPEEIVDFFGEIGVTSTKINPISMIGDAQATWNRMAITSTEYFEFLDRFIAYVVDSRSPLREANLAEYLKYIVRRQHDYRCMRSNCGAGESFFLIDAKGDVYPCAHSAGIPEWRLGTIEDARDGLRSLGRRNPVMVQFRGRLVEKIEETKGCPWRHLCEGGCAVNAYQKFGTILAPDSLCSFYERIYPRLFELLAAEPMRFQALLDTVFGKGRVHVVPFELNARSELPGKSVRGNGVEGKEVRPRYHAVT